MRWLESTGAPSFPLSGGGLLLRPGRMRDVKLLNALFDTAIPLVPRNRSADMVPASALACSRDFLLRLAVSHDTAAWAPSRGEGSAASSTSCSPLPAHRDPQMALRLRAIAACATSGGISRM
jgi:hypothetical protein